jgi:RNA polymerase sigma-70 factor (ECF subfamily)
MSDMSGPETSVGAGGSPERFRTTRWSVVLAARDGPSPEARQALRDLCEAYWYPLYAFIRRQGHPAEEARDLTQEFFLRLLEKDFLALVDQSRGKFRSFLMAACKHFLANERDRARAQKRGGGREVLSLDAQAGESRYIAEPTHDLTAERLFERRWALLLLHRVLERLRDEWRRAGKGEQFETLKAFLTGEKPAGQYAEAAAALGATPGAVRVAAHRLRRRYRELLREEIARTVNDPGEVEAEIRDLIAALGT